MPKKKKSRSSCCGDIKFAGTDTIFKQGPPGPRGPVGLPGSGDVPVPNEPYTPTLTISDSRTPFDISGFVQASVMATFMFSVPPLQGLLTPSFEVTFTLPLEKPNNFTSAGDITGTSNAVVADSPIINIPTLIAAIPGTKLGIITISNLPDIVTRVGVIFQYENN